MNDRLSGVDISTANGQLEAAELKDQLKELKVFAEKIDQLLASGYDPKLDDGVGKNIAPLQKAGLLSYEVLNAGQLKNISMLTGNRITKKKRLWRKIHYTIKISP